MGHFCGYAVGQYHLQEPRICSYFATAEVALTVATRLLAECSHQCLLFRLTVAIMSTAGDAGRVQPGGVVMPDITLHQFIRPRSCSSLYEDIVTSRLKASSYRDTFYDDLVRPLFCVRSSARSRSMTPAIHLKRLLLGVLFSFLCGNHLHEVSAASFPRENHLQSASCYV